jgi:hypothetical protein
MANRRVRQLAHSRCAKLVFHHRCASNNNSVIIIIDASRINVVCAGRTLNRATLMCLPTIKRRKRGIDAAEGLCYNDRRRAIHSIFCSLCVHIQIYYLSGHSINAGRSARRSPFAAVFNTRTRTHRINKSNDGREWPGVC